jgi:methionine synthase II (cobalamin-independent)
MRPSLSLEPFEITGIGSLPHRDPEEAVRFIFRYLEKIPHWPQLPKRDKKEEMTRQFLEGMPGIREEEDRIWIEPPSEAPEEWERFYEELQKEDLSPFGISPERAMGFYAFLEGLKGKKVSFVKGQIIGPFTLGFSLKDKKGRFAFYDEEIREMIVKALNRKAKWQVRKLKEVKPDVEVILFFDEPALVGLGTPQISIGSEKVIRALKETKEGLEAFCGIHICGNTEWPLILRAGFEVVSLDAYLYGDSFLTWAKEIKDFLESGGIIAWGIVPTDREILKREDPDKIVRKLEGILSKLQKEGLKEGLLRRALLTPSCGTGTLEEEEAKRVYKFLYQVSHRFKNLTK